MYKKIEKCRICGNPHLECVLDLGKQMLTGVFPREKAAKVTCGPLRLVKCTGEKNVCGLLQLEHSYDLGEMYGENYGYRSGLNASMVKHLHTKVQKILDQVQLCEGDLVIDIGSNDSTTLQAYPSSGLNLVGVDPTGIKFRDYYPAHIQLIPDFFSSDLLKRFFPEQKAKIITSFSMFYDLEDPMGFMREVHEVLADNGVWVFEQSYMPTMLEKNSYDTVCHEHLEYYSLHQIKWMTDRVGFEIVDIEFNEINGGSFSVIAKKRVACVGENSFVEEVLKKEREIGLDGLDRYKEFAVRVSQSRESLKAFLKHAKSEGKVVGALGASTKGNVILQYCGVTAEDICYVGEVNSEKFGCYTPGTWIPIVPEDDLLKLKPDYLVVLPWHFRDFFLSREKYNEFKLIFPLPAIENS